MNARISICSREVGDCHYSRPLSHSRRKIIIGYPKEREFLLLVRIGNAIIKLSLKEATVW